MKLNDISQLEFAEAEEYLYAYIHSGAYMCM
jgi:hypothetical protein